jgi:hypothetical protein
MFLSDCGKEKESVTTAVFTENLKAIAEIVSQEFCYARLKLGFHKTLFMREPHELYSSSFF